MGKLLLESGDALLLETGDALLLEVPINVIELAITDGATFSEALDRAYEARPTITEGIVLSESVSTQAILQATITDGLTLAETILVGGTHNLTITDGITLGETLVISNVYSLLISDGFTMSDAAVTALYLRQFARKYIVEIHDGDGNLVAILENANNISYSEATNQPNSLTFNIPSDDSKEANITLANEIWLKDYSSGEIIRKFLLGKTKDIRK